MKRPGLRGQILLMLLAPLVAFAPATVWIIHQGVMQAISREMDSRGSLVARQTAAAVLDEILTGERAAAEVKLSEVVRSDPELAYVFVVDPQGSIAAHSFSGGFPADLLRVHSVDRTAKSAVKVVLGGHSVHDVAEPMLDGIAGHVHVGINVDKAFATPRLVLLRLTMVGLAVVACGVVLTLLLSERMARRLSSVSRAAEAIGAGDLEVKLRDGRDDEIGRLSRSFDEMARRLRQARDERERTLRRMAQAEKLVAVGRLAAGVAHEINNPLSGVIHCLDNLEGDLLDAQRWKTYAPLMRDGVGRAQRVVRRLLDYAKEHELDLRQVDLPALVARSLALLQPSIERANVRVLTRVEPDLAAVTADPHLLEQVVLNLLLNALEAMPSGGIVEVECSKAGAGCRLRIHDQGAGIPANTLERIFDPFFTTKGGSKGSGLGLSVTLGIVERHHGRVEVTSKQGEGATFDVYLPFEQPEARAGLAERRDA